MSCWWKRDSYGLYKCNTCSLYLWMSLNNLPKKEIEVGEKSTWRDYSARCEMMWLSYTILLCKFIGSYTKRLWHGLYSISLCILLLLIFRKQHTIPSKFLRQAKTAQGWRLFYGYNNIFMLCVKVRQNITIDITKYKLWKGFVAKFHFHIM